MATVIKNKKGFKVLEVSAREMIEIKCGFCCDGCRRLSESGFYVAVLNRWLCKKCYEQWYATAENYAEEGNADQRVEDKNYRIRCEMLGVCCE